MFHAGPTQYFEMPTVAPFSALSICVTHQKPIYDLVNIH